MVLPKDDGVVDDGAESIHATEVLDSLLVVHWWVSYDDDAGGSSKRERKVTQRCWEKT